MAGSQLSQEQLAVARAIVRIARKRRESPKEVKAAIETGLVESGLRNLSYGDADSQGWRQERASLYSNPTNLSASINRFFNETSAVQGKYGTAGALAAAVQRPAAQYRGRYQEVSQDAEAILRRLGADGPWGGGGGGRGGGGAAAALSPVMGGVPASGSFDQAAYRRAKDAALVGQMLARRNGTDSSLFRTGLLTTQAPDPSQFMQPQNLAAILAAARQTRPSSRPAQGAAPTGVGRRPSSQLLEMFYRGPGGINVDNGKVVGRDFVDGHESHVHVAANPRDVLALGRLAQRMGLRVAENPRFGGVTQGAHVTNSLHYSRRAIDVSGGSPSLLRRFNRRVARMYGV